MRKEEDILRANIALYLHAQYEKKLVWRFDLAADIFIGDTRKMSKIEAGKKKRYIARLSKLQTKHTGHPDLFIAEPVAGYSGLYIELKKNKEEVYKKNGEYRRNKHLLDQLDMHKMLKDKGYQVLFCWSLAGFIKILEEYLNPLKSDSGDAFTYAYRGFDYINKDKIKEVLDIKNKNISFDKNGWEKAKEIKQIKTLDDLVSCLKNDKYERFLFVGAMDIKEFSKELDKEYPFTDFITDEKEIVIAETNKKVIRIYF